MAYHDQLENAIVAGNGSGIADPVAYEQQDGCSDDGLLGAFVQQIDGQGARDGESEQEAGREPVDCAFRYVEIK